MQLVDLQGIQTDMKGAMDLKITEVLTISPLEPIIPMAPRIP